MFVDQLARFLGVCCDKAQLEALVESCNQLIEQCSKSEALSVCRGEYQRREEELRRGGGRSPAETPRLSQGQLTSLVLSEA